MKILSIGAFFGFFLISFLNLFIVIDAYFQTANHLNEHVVVSIQNGIGQNCSGVIVSSYDVVTTVNCTRGAKEHIIVRSGSNHRRFGVSLHNVTNITVHEHYHISQYPVNDIAIIRVKQAFNHTRPMNLLNHPLKENTTANAIKWTRLSVLHEELRGSSVSIVNQTKCNYEYHGKLHPGQICATNNVTDHSTCFDNAGVPLIVNGSLAGIFSFGQGCPSYKPMVYTEIAYYRDWINKHIAHNTTGHKHHHSNPLGPLFHGSNLIPNVVGQPHHPSNNGPNSHNNSSSGSHNNNQLSNIMNKLNPMKPNSKNSKSSSTSIVPGFVAFYIVHLIFVSMILNF